jgi:hypothetical protein
MRGLRMKMGQPGTLKVWNTDFTVKYEGFVKNPHADAEASRGMKITCLEAL